MMRFLLCSVRILSALSHNAGVLVREGPTGRGADVTSSKRVYQALEGRRHPTKAARGYNRGHLCLLLQAHNLAPMKSGHLWAPAGWARFTGRPTRVSNETSPSRFCLLVSY